VILRALFALLLLHAEVADPPSLWRSFREALCEDFLRAVGMLEAAEGAGLSELQDLLAVEHAEVKHSLRRAPGPVCG
jgi:hypothetical protein